MLILAAIVQTIAVDTSICERGFSLMNNLKTARRSSMGKPVLRMLMTVCSLGAVWKDPSKFLVKEIIEEWRAQSGRGRYEGAGWSAESLAALLGDISGGGGGGGGSGSGGGGSGGGGGGGERPLAAPTRRMNDEDDGRADVNNTSAGGLFSWLGRDAAERRGVHAGTHLGRTTMMAS